MGAGPRRSDTLGLSQGRGRLGAGMGDKGALGGGGRAGEAV